MRVNVCVSHKRVGGLGMRSRPEYEAGIAKLKSANVYTAVCVCPPSKLSLSTSGVRALFAASQLSKKMLLR